LQLLKRLELMDFLFLALN